MYEAWFIVLPSAYNAPHFLEISMVRDILLGLMKRLVKMRASNLKVLITSATLDGSKVSRFFSNCPILTVPGKLFPVEILYSAELPKSYIESSLKTAIGTFWTWVYSMQNFYDLWNAYRHAFHYYVYKIISSITPCIILVCGIWIFRHHHRNFLTIMGVVGYWFEFVFLLSLALWNWFISISRMT